MASKADDEIQGYFVVWEINNISHSWWKTTKYIKSPIFSADAFEGTEWSLHVTVDPNRTRNGFFLKRENDCSGPDMIEISYRFSFRNKYGSILKYKYSDYQNFVKSDYSGFLKFETTKNGFFNREMFHAEDSLILVCEMWKVNNKPAKFQHLCISSTFKEKISSFSWNIEKISSLKTSARSKFKNELTDFDLVLSKDFERLDVDVISIDDNVKYISCTSSIINSKGEKEFCGDQKYFESHLKKGVLSPSLLCPKKFMENKNRYLPNDILAFKFLFSTIQCFQSEYAKFKYKTITSKEESQDMSALTYDLNTMLNNGSFSDTEIRTSTKTFAAHKAILSARSPVFGKIFSSDMKEKICGHVDIIDLDEDTVHRMLLYMYTDSFENVKLETALDLYIAADKYEILSLKDKCSSFIKDNLSATNVCDVLVLADLHQDKNLKSWAEEYIIEHDKEIISSSKWKDFMHSNVKLAADVMYRKLYLT